MCHTLHRPKEFNNLFPLGPPSFTHPSQPRWAFNPRWKPAVTSREQRASCTNSCVCGRGTKPVGWPGRCWFSPLYLRKKIKRGPHGRKKMEVSDGKTWPTSPEKEGKTTGWFWTFESFETSKSGRCFDTTKKIGDLQKLRHNWLFFGAGFRDPRRDPRSDIMQFLHHQMRISWNGGTPKLSKMHHS